MVEYKSKRILPVAIMAHNEENVISQSIQSCFEQVCPLGFIIWVIVVANGCTDSTEGIVTAIAEQYQGRLKLISMEEKGKTIALNRAIAYIETQISEEAEIPYVIFMDADCEFVRRDVMIKFVKCFEEVPLLCAVGATNVPKKIHNHKTNIVSDMYLATDELNKMLPENGISGGAYCIKQVILKEIKFPKIQMADDMYVSMKLDGWMLRDQNIVVAYTIPDNLRGELKKRIRHEIATRKFFEYHRQLIKTGSQIAIYSSPLDDKFRWTGFSTLDVVVKLFKIKRMKNIILICLSITIRLLAKIAANNKFKKIQADPALDYWQVER